MIPKRTAQETFDTVINHLRKQNCVSLGANLKCAYRGADGRMCAVGVLIPDEDYVPEIENKNAGALVHSPIEVSEFGDRFMNLIPSDMAPKIGKGMLAALQNLHDNGMRLSSMEQIQELMAERIARDFNLVYTPPSGATA